MKSETNSFTFEPINGDAVPPQCNPPELDLCEDLSDLQSVNECGALHTLTSRAKANLPLTHAGPNLVNFWPPLQTHSKVKFTYIYRSVTL